MRKSTLRRILAARANGAKSHGPSTPEGRKRSAQNARTHELTAQTVVLSNEDRESFDQLFQTYLDILKPQNRLELDLVNDAVVSKWRHMRIWSMEGAIQDLEMAEQKPQIEKKHAQIAEPTRNAKANKSLNDRSTFLGNLSVYEARHRRAHERALKLLADLRGGDLGLKLQIQSDPAPATAPARPRARVRHPKTDPPPERAA